MKNLIKILEYILEVSEYAPELNMCNYDEEQVRQLNDAMIEIYLFTKKALADSREINTNRDSQQFNIANEKMKNWKDCPKCGLEMTYGKLITNEWYCWNCCHIGL